MAALVAMQIRRQQQRQTILILELSESLKFSQIFLAATLTLVATELTSHLRRTQIWAHRKHVLIVFHCKGHRKCQSKVSKRTPEGPPTAASKALNRANKSMTSAGARAFKGAV